MTMLAGVDLLAKVKEMGDASKSDLVRACGYVSTKKDGGERLNFTAFYVGKAFSKSGAAGGQGAQPWGWRPRQGQAGAGF